MLWRIVRRLLAVVIQMLIWRPVVSLAVLALGLGLVGFIVGGTSRPNLIRSSLPASTAPPNVGTPAVPIVVQTAPPMTPPPAVDQYIKGMVTFNAHLMWQALDQQAIQEMVSQGGSEQALQQRLDDARQQGASYDGVAFIGGYPLRNGDSYLFYVVSRRGFAGRGVADQVFFVFTVGPNGKIIKIE
ncbi:MAG TPA: hypothetical protein VKY56_00735 [Chloroflexota bacterium]|nr:hypothetical protein [Chloroflexota bacterium]